MLYVIYPENFGEIWNFLKILDFFWKISNYNFQSRRQIMIIRGVYSQKMTKYDGELSKKDENFHKKGGNYTKMTEISARVTCYNAFNIVMDLLGVQPGNLRGCWWKEAPLSHSIACTCWFQNQTSWLRLDHHSWNKPLEAKPLLLLAV